MSVMSDGVTLIRRVGGTWKVYSRKKPEVSMDVWKASVEARYDKIAPWKKQIKSLPTLQTLDKWSRDCVCSTPTGHMVEPDGIGPDGVPSWLVILGVI